MLSMKSKMRQDWMGDLCPSTRKVKVASFASVFTRLNKAKAGNACEIVEAVTVTLWPTDRQYYCIRLSHVATVDSRQRDAIQAFKLFNLVEFIYDIRNAMAASRASGPLLLLSRVSSYLRQWCGRR